MAKKSSDSTGRLSRTEKLFPEAHRHNWDLGHARLLKILKDPDCDLATALLIYWRGRPEFYRQWKSPKEAPPSVLDGYRFVEGVEKRILAGDYRTVIAYDPKSEIGRYTDLERDFVRELPAAVYEASRGTIPADDLIHGRRGEGAFLAAAKAGDIERLRALMETGLDVDVTDGGFTALQVASTAGQVETVTFLLRMGADPRLKDTLDGNTHGWNQDDLRLAAGESSARRRSQELRRPRAFSAALMSASEAGSLGRHACPRCGLSRGVDYAWSRHAAAPKASTFAT